MTIDADELERLRKAYVIFPDVLSLIAELKKARAISDEYHKRWLPLCVERDSARAEQARWHKKFDTQVIKDRNELLAKDETIKALVEALENIARQKTDAELGDDGPFGSNYDFAEGYDCCVMRARAAIAAFLEKRP